MIGAALAPEWYPGRLGAALAAFFLAVGIGAHALDELNGRPLATQDPRPRPGRLAAVSIAAAVAIGIAGAIAFDLWLLAFVARRRVRRLRLQPRALRRAVPLRRLVRARLGRVPAPDRLLRVRRARSAGRRCSPPRSPPSRATRSGGCRARSGGCGARSPSVSGTIELDRRQPRADHARDADRRQRGRAARARAPRWSRSRSRSSCCARREGLTCGRPSRTPSTARSAAAAATRRAARHAVWTLTTSNARSRRRPQAFVGLHQRTSAALRPRRLRADDRRPGEPGLRAASTLLFGHR